MASIELNLSRHCIHTEIKRRHSRCLSDYFAGRGDVDTLEGEIDLLARALTELDLPSMRGSSSVLAGGDDITVRLSGSDEVPFSLTHQGEPLPLLYRRKA